MADSKITALTAISTVDPAADPLVIVDVSDTSMAASGTTKKGTINQLLGAGGTATLASATITGDLTVDTNTLKVDSANNRVGINKASPAYALDVVGNATISATAGNNNWFYIAGNGNTVGSTSFDIGQSSSNEGYVFNRANGPIIFGVNNTTAMTLNATGLGVGTSPSARFHSKAGAVTQGGIIETTGANALLSFADAGTSSYTRVQIGSSGNNLAAFINSVQAMTLDASGNLLVGVTSTTTPGVGNTTAGGSLNANGAAFFSNASSQALYLNTNVDGQIVSIRRSNVAVGSISVTTTATAYNTSSDYRLKEAVQPLVGGLARISALKPSVYKWKADGSNGEGFLAHELAEVVPLAVTGEKDAVNEDGSIKAQGVDLSKVVPVLVAAIQELTARVQTLETR